MKCPNCGKENHVGAGESFHCNQAMPITTALRIRVSRAAVAAAILGIVSIVGFIMFFVAGGTSRFPRFPLVSKVAALTFIMAGLAAILLAIVAIVSIWQSGGARTGTAFALLGFLGPVCAFALFIAHLLLFRTGGTAYRMVCGTNLSGIGKAMAVYANDFRDELPRAGGPTSLWTGRTPNWMAQDCNNAFASSNGPGEVSITASLYLLVKYADVTPKSFVCTSDKGTTELKPAKYKAAERKLIDLWDFGPYPAKHCSYAYQTPYSKYALTTSSDPNMPIVADRNAFQDSPFRKAKDIRRFSPENRESMKHGNSYSHQNEGQNVLFLDGHANFQKTPICGINDDNIWTVQDGNDITIGKAPTIGSRPANKQDSLLVTDGAGGDSKR